MEQHRDRRIVDVHSQDALAAFRRFAFLGAEARPKL
jgi:hypothetical protein